MHGAGAAGIPAAARSAIFRPRIHVERVGIWLLDIVGGFCGRHPRGKFRFRRRVSSLNYRPQVRGSIENEELPPLYLPA